MFYFTAVAVIATARVFWKYSPDRAADASLHGALRMSPLLLL